MKPEDEAWIKNYIENEVKRQTHFLPGAITESVLLKIELKKAGLKSPVCVKCANYKTDMIGYCQPQDFFDPITGHDRLQKCNLCPAPLGSGLCRRGGIQSGLQS